jgi:GAF domain-containing protein
MYTQFETYDEVLSAARTAPGVLLFTVSAIADQGTSMARVFTTHPDVYPVGGKKMFASDTNPVWLEQVIRGHKPFFGPDTAAVRSFFFDHETIESLGCGAIINVPVVRDGETVGSMNFLDAERRYSQESVEAAQQVAARSADLLAKSLHDFS